MLWFLRRAKPLSDSYLLPVSPPPHPAGGWRPNRCRPRQSRLQLRRALNLKTFRNTTPRLSEERPRSSINTPFYPVCDRNRFRCGRHRLKRHLAIEGELKSVVDLPFVELAGARGPSLLGISSRGRRRNSSVERGSTSSTCCVRWTMTPGTYWLRQRRG